MKKLFLMFTFAMMTSVSMFTFIQDADAWWSDDDDYWDRPWYGGGPWYGGYGYPYGGYGYPYGGGYYPYGGGYYGGGYPYGGGYGYPYGGYAYPQGTVESETQTESTAPEQAPAYPAYPAY